MTKLSTESPSKKIVGTNSDSEEFSSRGRVKSIDRLICNFFEIVGLDDFSHEMSEGSGPFNKNNNLQSSIHSTATRNESSFSCDAPTTIEKIDVVVESSAKQRKQQDENRLSSRSAHIVRGISEKKIQKSRTDKDMLSSSSLHRSSSSLQRSSSSLHRSSSSLHRSSLSSSSHRSKKGRRTLDDPLTKETPVLVAAASPGEGFVRRMLKFSKRSKMDGSSH
jgi:hypothetical protein